MIRQPLFLIVLTTCVGGLFLTGCPPKKKLAIEEPTTEESEMLEGESEGELVKEPGDIEIDQDWSEIPALKNVLFGYDKANLDKNQRSVLKQNVATIKKLPKTVTLRVEGHCDDRGTIEYNIALGQRRANVVRGYYVTAGTNRSRVETISFGEERPTCNFQTDECWAQNRRGVTKVKNTEAIIIKADELK